MLNKLVFNCCGLRFPGANGNGGVWHASLHQQDHSLVLFTHRQTFSQLWKCIIFNQTEFTLTTEMWKNIWKLLRPHETGFVWYAGCVFPQCREITMYWCSCWQSLTPELHNIFLYLIILTIYYLLKHLKFMIIWICVYASYIYIYIL